MKLLLFFLIKVYCVVSHKTGVVDIGNKRNFEEERTCQTNHSNQSYHHLKGKCTLAEVFHQYMKSNLDEKTSTYLNAKSTLCSGVQIHENNSHTFECSTHEGLVILTPRHLQTSNGKTDVIVSTIDANYKNMTIDIIGPYRSTFVKLHKDENQEDMVMKTTDLFVDFDVEEFLKTHFNVEFKKLSGDLDLVPKTLSNVTFSALIKPLDHFELIFYAEPERDFFVIQLFESASVPSIGFFKKLERRKPLDVINEKLKINIREGFMPFLEVTASSFSSCTSSIPVIMSVPQLDFVKTFMTESNTVAMPEGKMLRWVIDDSNNVKKTADYYDGEQTTNQGEKFQDSKVNKSAYSSKVGLSAVFDVNLSNINIVSKDTLQAKFKDIIQTFILIKPDMSIEDYKIDESIIEKEVLFNKLSILVETQQVKLDAMVVEDWLLAGNMVNLKGINLTVVASILNESWSIKGEGNIIMLGQSVFVKIEKSDNNFYITGDFPARNISELRSLFNNVSFVPENFDVKHLDEVQFSVLSFKMKLDSPVLKFNGESLSTANPDDLSSKTIVEIVLRGDEQKQNMVVGICHKNVFLELMVNEIFHIAMEGVPWLKFDELCFLIANEIADELSYFNNTGLSEMLHLTGINYVGKIASQSQCAFMGPGSSDLDSVDSFCRFLVKNPFFLEEKVIGFITPTSHEFIAKIQNSEFVRLNESQLSIKNVVMRLKHVNKNSTTQPVVENPTKEESELHRAQSAQHLASKRSDEEEPNSIEHFSKKQIMNLFIEGKFSASEKMYTLDFTGEISSRSPSEVILNCTDVSLQFETGEGIIFFETQGQSAAENSAFSLFEFTSPLRMSFNGIKLFFNESASLQLNLNEPKKTFFSAREVQDLKDVKLILKNFFENNDHILFSNIKSFGSCLYVWTLTDKIIDQKSNKIAEANSLKIFGTVERSGDTHEYDIKVTKGFLEYNEILSPIIFSNRLLKFFSEDGSRTNGPKLVARWNESNLDVKIKGVFETIGVSKPFFIEIKKDGQFDLLLESREKFFDEVQAVITIIQSNAIDVLDDANPFFHANLMAEKSHVENIVKNHLRSLSQNFTRAYNGFAFKNNGEDEAFKPVDDIREILLPLHEKINTEVRNLYDLNEILDTECVDKCNAEGTVDIPDIIWNNEKGKMLLVPDEFKTANVTCIVGCELEKSQASSNYEVQIDEVKILTEKYYDLMAQAEEIHDLYIIHESKIHKEINRFENLKSQFSDFPYFPENEDESFFELISLEIQRDMNEIEVNGDKCVHNISGVYKMFDVTMTFSFPQCFNGEYANYFANQLAQDYLGNKLDNLKGLLKLYDRCLAKHEENLKNLKDSLTEFFAKHGLNQTQQNEKRSFSQFTALPHRRMIGVVKKTPKHTLVFSTRSIYMPQISEKDRAKLKENRFTVTRSMKTRAAFMYSSPWAAVSTLNLEKSFKNAEVFVRDVAHKKSHCNTVEHISNQYSDIFKNLRSISDSYEKTSFKLNQVYNSMKKGVGTLRNRAIISSNNTKKLFDDDKSYWIRQLDNGMNLFSELVKKKLSNHSATALNLFKSKFQDGLKRTGIPDIPTFMNVLRKRFHAASKRSFTPSSRLMDLSSATKLSNVLTSVLKKPEVKLDELSERLHSMKRYLKNVNVIATSCSR